MTDMCIITANNFETITTNLICQFIFIVLYSYIAGIYLPMESIQEKAPLPPPKKAKKKRGGRPQNNAFLVI